MKELKCNIYYYVDPKEGKDVLSMLIQFVLLG